MDAIEEMCMVIKDSIEEETKIQSAKEIQERNIEQARIKKNKTKKHLPMG